MTFSKGCEYAIKAVLYICIHSENGEKLSTREIANDINSPEPFTAKILQSLVQKGIISSSKGPGGGFYIKPESKPIYIMDIVKIIDGKHAFERCGLGLKNCDPEHPCPIHKELNSYSTRLKNLLEKKTIQEFADSISEGLSFLSN